MKVFFDSNIYLSDALFGGAAELAIDLTLSARWRIIASEFVLHEIHQVLTTKFQRSAHFSHLTTSHLRRIATVLPDPLPKHRVPGDPNDTLILSAAVLSNSHFLITRDTKILALSQIQSTRILTLTDYLLLLKSHGTPQP